MSKFNMAPISGKDLPRALRDAQQSDARTQCAMICWRPARTGAKPVVKGKSRAKAKHNTKHRATPPAKPEILLITSRGTGRWIVPKGWPITGLSVAESAQQEAWEEAGVTGRMNEQCLGLYSYTKYSEDGGELPCVAMVYSMQVKTIAAEFPEAEERSRRWVGRKKAANLVDEPELAALLRNFDPKTLRKSRA